MILSHIIKDSLLKEIFTEDVCRFLVTWILISLELGDISGDEESEILCQLNTTVDAGGTGRVTYIYRPQFHIREKLLIYHLLQTCKKGERHMISC